jgi:hypothetical protein
MTTEYNNTAEHHFVHYYSMKLNLSNMQQYVAIKKIPHRQIRTPIKELTQEQEPIHISNDLQFSAINLQLQSW